MVITNKKAKAFQSYLQKNNITCFTIDEIKNDEVNTVVFRSFLEVEGQKLPTWIILDSSIYTMVRVQIATVPLEEQKKEALLEALNKLNLKYKIFKYYLTNEGTIVLDSHILNKPEEVDPDMVYTVLDILLKHLKSEYKNLMKVIWNA